MNINQDFLVRSIFNSATSVFSMMLGMELIPGDHDGQLPAPSENGKVVALIGMAGAWIGTGMISCAPVLACRISSLMLMTPCESVSEDVLDAMAEMANMIFGNVKTDLEDHLGELGLSIPTVIFGRNFDTRSVCEQSWTVVRAMVGEDHLEMRICLIKNHEHRASSRSTLRQYALQQHDN